MSVHVGTFRTVGTMTAKFSNVAFMDVLENSSINKSRYLCLHGNVGLFCGSFRRVSSNVIGSSGSSATLWRQREVYFRRRTKSVIFKK